MFQKNSIRILYNTSIYFILGLFTLTSHAAIYYIKTDGDDATTGTSWETALRTISSALTRVSTGDEIWVAKGTYQEGNTFTVPSKVVIYGGFAGNEISPSERNLSLNPSTIDGEMSYSCIKNWGYLDGFCITRGKDNDSSSDCGGIWNWGTVYNCIVFENTSSGFVGGICNDDGLVSDCIVFSNTPGGIHNEDWVVNCIVYNNTGGGIYNDQFGVVVNCTVYGNYGSQIGGITNNWVVSNSIVWKNEPTDISGILEWVSYSCFTESKSDNGNIKGNPLFVNTYGDPDSWDFHLQNGSPCIDSAIYLNAPEKDIEGNPRPGGDGKFCMGAFESPDEYTPSDPLPALRLHVSKTGSNTDGLSWQTAFRTIDQALRATDDIGEIWIAKGAYKEGKTISISEKIETIYGGFSGMEQNLDERYILQFPTVIDGENSYPCIINYTRIDGLHITKGYSEEIGSGISNYGDVDNCIVFNNASRGNGGSILNHGTISNSIVYNNTGVGILNAESGMVVNCVIYNNFSLRFGGINNNGIVRNSIIWKNIDCDVTGNLDTVYHSCFMESQGVNDNIKGNPFFVETTGNPNNWDFRLKNGSPCVDSASSTNAPQKDIMGNPRPGGDGLICMGALESQDDYTSSPPLPVVRYYVSKVGSNTDGLSWETAFRSINQAINTTDDICEIWVTQGVYKEGETIYLTRRIINMYGGFSGTEHSLDERNVSKYPTVVDGVNSYKCLNNYSHVDGFNITRGKGGGVTNLGTLSNCAVYDNKASYPGGGIYNSHGVITHCDVYNNNTTHYEFWSSYNAGGGIYNYEGEVSHTLVHHNSAHAEALLYFGTSEEAITKGGGIYNVRGCVSNCIIFENSTRSISHTSYLFGSDAYSYGGGIYNDNGSIINTTVYGNRLSSYIYDLGMYKNIPDESHEGKLGINHTKGISRGCGIYNYNGNISNCIVKGNSYSYFSHYYLVTVPSDVYLQSGSITYSCFLESNGNDGNINVDPLFLNIGENAIWDFRLIDNSPCIDAGNPEEKSNDGCLPPGKGESRNDMGAFGGPLNCGWVVSVEVNDIIDYILGRSEVTSNNIIFLKQNADLFIDISDVITILKNSPPKSR